MIEKTHRVNAQPLGVALQCLEGDVSLTTFEATDVGPVDAEDIGEGLLGEAAFFPVLTEVPTECLLEFSLHGSQEFWDCYLRVYRLISSIARERRRKEPVSWAGKQGKTMVRMGEGKTRTASVLVVLTAAGLMVGLGGCGSSASAVTTSSVSSAGSTTAPNTTSPQTIVTTTTGAPTTPTAAAVIDASDSGGDSITTTVSFGPAEPVSSSNVDQSVLGSCGFDTSRALVVAGQLHTVDNSSLAIKVEETFLWSAMDPGAMYFVLAYTNGTQCATPDDNPYVQFTVQPDQYDDFSFWIVLAGAITPDNPDGDPATLGQWVLQAPGVLLEGNPADNVSVSGLRVISCQDNAGDQYTYLVPAGSPPPQIGGDLYGQSCTTG